MPERRELANGERKRGRIPPPGPLAKSAGTHAAPREHAAVGKKYQPENWLVFFKWWWNTEPNPRSLSEADSNRTRKCPCFRANVLFPRERYQLKGDADWVGERGSSHRVEPEFDSAFRNRTGVRIDLSSLQIEGLKAGQGVGPVVEAMGVNRASSTAWWRVTKASKIPMVQLRRRLPS